MSIKIRGTKAFLNLPCGHAQYFDLEPDGSPGQCASVHGYDRSAHFTFAGDVDEYGWIYPFGDLKPVKEFLEYYFDHVTVLPADDPRLGQITEELTAPGGILGTLRILPYGVSMEMSSLFIWEHVNPYIYQSTGGRVYIEKIELKEHERNSGYLEVDEATAKAQAQRYLSSTVGILPKVSCHDFEAPRAALRRLNGE